MPTGYDGTAAIVIDFIRLRSNAIDVEAAANWSSASRTNYGLAIEHTATRRRWWFAPETQAAGDTLTFAASAAITTAMRAAVDQDPHFSCLLVDTATTGVVPASFRFQLGSLVDITVDRIEELFVDGERTPLTGSGWHFDTARQQLVRASSVASPAQSLMTFYSGRYVISVSRSGSPRADAVTRADIPSPTEGMSLANSLADRHQRPIEVVEVLLVPTYGNELAKGTTIGLPGAALVRAGVENVTLDAMNNPEDEDWLIAGVTLTDIGDMLYRRLRLLRRGFESRFRE